MTIHTDFDRRTATPVALRREAGQRANLSGLSAEKTVVLEYLRRGVDLLETRWRGQGGEIDLIFRDDDTVIFAEVKKARSFDQAIARLRPAQMQRIHAAASEYLAFTPDGQLSNVRFDLAAVDGSGRVKIIENAFAHF